VGGKHDLILIHVGISCVHGVWDVSPTRRAIFKIHFKYNTTTVSSQAFFAIFKRFFDIFYKIFLLARSKIPLKQGFLKKYFRGKHKNTLNMLIF